MLADCQPANEPTSSLTRVPNGEDCPIRPYHRAPEGPTERRVYQKQIEIRWRDLDGYAHVNHAVYVTYLEEARDEWLAETLAEATAGWDHVMVHLSIDYRRQLTQDDDVVVAACEAVSLGTSSVTTREELRTGAGELVAEASAVVVALDPATGRSRPLSDRERGLLGARTSEDAERARRSRAAVRIEAWGEDDLPVLEMTLGDPEMTRYLGGPESEEQLAERQARYEGLAGTGTGRMFKIVDERSGQAVGSVGYWEKSWRGQTVYEMGWFVIPGYQGRGIGAAASAQAIAEAGSERKHRFMHAFPSVENGASNAICRKLGFTLLEACDFEYPPGTLIRCNDWRLDLFAAG
jgi:YbgC/YbaW family acyl-CoA thioester hydrolase